MATTLKTPRYDALDVLRGMTVAGMILVNNPGSWAHIFPPLRHASWVGCTPTDLVFPFFLFCVGVATAFAFSKFDYTLTGKSAWTVVRRSILIFLVGLGLNMFPFFPMSPHDPSASFGENYVYWIQHLRIFGVLQRIAMCYLAGGLLILWLRKPKRLIIALFTLTILHWIILMLFGGEPGWSTLDGNISGKIDVALLGENHVYHGYGQAFDPEGLLGAISGSGTVILGFLMGWLVRNTPTRIEVVAKLYTFAALCLALGCVWSIWLPISKPLWTGSYVFYAGGWSTLMLAFFIYMIDVKGWKKPFVPFKATGMNPLFCFVMAGLISKIFGSLIHWTAVVDGVEKSWTPLIWFYQNVCCAVCGGNNEYSSLMYAICFVALFILLALPLYKKKIYIKI